MRKNNLRVWDKEKEEMWEDVLRGLADDEYYDEDTSMWEVANALEEGDQSRFVGLLYTGSPDRTGTDLYEGDLIHILPTFNGNDIYAEIYWKGAGFALRSDSGLDSSSGYLEMVLPHVVKVGNIFENRGEAE